MNKRNFFMFYFTRLLLLIPIIICFSCNNKSGTEKHQNKRENIIQAKEKLKEIVIEDVFIGPIANPSIIDDYLIITNSKTIDHLIYVFDKNNFKFLRGITNRGQGPDEIANIGHLATDEANRMFYVSDHGKLIIFAYHLDSVLSNPNYSPSIKMKMNKAIFPNNYSYINDTLCIGSIVEPIGNSDFKQSIAKWNMISEEIKPMKYNHPKIEKKQGISFAMSPENDIYVECFSKYDLMTICSLDGDLKYNIYGPNWTLEERVPKHHYGSVIFCNNTIWAAFSGGDWQTEYEPTKFFVFDLTGNYLKTVEIGYNISRFCFDKENNRLIINFNSEMQFAYLDLDGLID